MSYNFELFKAVTVFTPYSMELTGLFILIFLQVFECFLASGLVIDISVPNFKQKSENATLRCLYNLGTANTLYSIKWYKNEAEFYRYEPSEVPPKQYFSLSGVLVNLEDSDEYQVSLLNLSLASSGMYKCEVTTEAPEFHSTTARAFMTTIALPEESPKINGLKEIYINGEIINVNCTSSPSMPVTQLVWYVNGAKANSSWLTTFDVTPHLASSRETRTVNMQVKAGRHLFPSRVLSLRCVGSLAQRSWQDQKWTTLYQLTNGQNDITYLQNHGGIMQIVSILIAIYLYQNDYFQ